MKATTKDSVKRLPVGDVQYQSTRNCTDDTLPRAQQCADTRWHAVSVLVDARTSEVALVVDGQTKVRANIATDVRDALVRSLNGLPIHIGGLPGVCGLG
jgi:hypothetical protein